MIQADELFEICRRLADEGPTAKGLLRMHEMLVLCCAEGTRGKGAFGNLFAQVDYLCREHGFAATDKADVQTMRRHSNGQELPQEEEWLYDLRALALLISAVLRADVPGELRSRLPATARGAHASRLDKKAYVRCIVDHWDERLVSATTSEDEVTIDYGNTEQGRDFGYLRKIFRKGMQLNLLDCTVGQDGVLLPRLIIVEPDFLMDISSIAACFTPYGHHPLLYTVNRLKPRPLTQAILLGNFAGTALDEATVGTRRVASENAEYQIVNADATRRVPTYKKALNRSFREQGLRFCACPGFDAEKFKRDAEQQVKNIEEAVEQLRTQLDDNRTRNDDERTRHVASLLEPSFVCERLGLQGRVDLMTDDMRLLVEQKAGRNMKIERESHDPHGLQQESHYVQLLLYFGILRYNFGRTTNITDIRLLYSRYPALQGLLRVNYYHTLFAEALRLRNQIVATELLAAREGFGRLLPLLTPYYIYKGVKTDGYFTERVLPEITQLLAPLHTLNTMERAYLERMMTFVFREQACQKLGCAEARLHHSGGAASDLWLMPLAEKKETGNIIAPLAISRMEKSDDEGGYDLITLMLPESDADVSPLNFRRGDMIYLYAYDGGEPDVRRSILFKGTLQELTSTEVTVRLNDGQQSAQGFSHPQWAVEHGSSDLMASTAMRSLYQLLTATDRRRQLLLGQRPPETQSFQNNQSFQSIQSTQNIQNPHFHDLLQRIGQARDYFLLVGPPGTGKTSQALRLIVRQEQGNVLLMAYTNRAVDEICSMLEDEGVCYLRIGNEAACEPCFRHRLIERLMGDTPTLQQMRQLIDETSIVVGTTSTLASRQEIFELKHFSLAIVDEASQILEPNIIGLLSSEQIDRFVLVGDYKQLPAVVQQGEELARVEEQCLLDICLTDCRQSLFERLIRWEQHCGRTQFIGTLSRQGRMHPDVASFASTHFYANEHLQPVPLAHQQESGPLYAIEPADALDRLLCGRRMLFFDTDREANLVATVADRIAAYLGRQFCADTSVGIIVTYRNQISAIRQAIARQPHARQLQDVCIDTVERYQGSQRDVIVYALGIGHYYQLDFLTASTFTEDGHLIDRKLNVALTRARRQTILVGQASLLRQTPLLSEIIGQYGVSGDNFL